MHVRIQSKIDHFEINLLVWIVIDVFCLFLQGNFKGILYYYQMWYAFDKYTHVGLGQFQNGHLIGHVMTYIRISPTNGFILHI